MADTGTDVPAKEGNMSQAPASRTGVVPDREAVIAELRRARTAALRLLPKLLATSPEFAAIITVLDAVGKGEEALGLKAVRRRQWRRPPPTARRLRLTDRGKKPGYDRRDFAQG